MADIDFSNAATAMKLILNPTNELTRAFNALSQTEQDAILETISNSALPTTNFFPDNASDPAFRDVELQFYADDYQMPVEDTVPPAYWGEDGNGLYRIEKKESGEGYVVRRKCWRPDEDPQEERPTGWSPKVYNPNLNNTPQELVCSHCQASGELFKCPVCNIMPYCSERCRNADWEIHRERCEHDAVIGHAGWTRRHPRLSEVGRGSRA
ncbi:hypothetical protein BU16DRAFT_556409 [Lophium mytilinum]|uniref:MYND-type domain-containing protein n=1 Tax=Lophium mytilinum TaxID=390894 RepID=A0A6A6R5T4_9PEZI|nr:hypothetical protein BU16DRAFT_556409 [Lophium mytilinum]